MLADRMAFRAENGFQAAVEKAAESEGLTASDWIRAVVRKQLHAAGIPIDINHRPPLPARRKSETVSDFMTAYDGPVGLIAA